MKNIFRGIMGIRVLTQEPLKKHTSFRIGGRARYFLYVENQKALMEVMKVIKKHRMKYLVIGQGTNILFRDSGFNGVIIKLQGDFKRITHCKNLFVSGAGVTIDDFLNTAASLNYGGAEYLAGIPGTIGGAVKSNAGAFGHSISELVANVTIFEAGKRMISVQGDKINFGYRHSDISDRAIILAVTLRMKKKPRNLIKREMRKFLELRWKKQPSGFSAGSFFKNPLPLSAGKLIEECGLKGTRVGGAVISKKHANFIINRGRAKAMDVIRLMKIVKQKVKAAKGIELEPEVRIV